MATVKQILILAAGVAIGVAAYKALSATVNSQYLPA